MRTDEEAWEARWFAMDELYDLEVGFDHLKIIKDAFSLLKDYALSYNGMIFNLLPATFTLAELQQVFEEILQYALTKQNFRRKMMEFVEANNS